MILTRKPDQQLDKSAEKALKKTGYVEFSKCIAVNLHKFALRDGTIFSEKGVEIAPGVVMTKALWKDAGKSTQKAIWDFLSSLTLLSSYEMKHNGPKPDGPVDDEEAFNKFFDISGADVDLKKMFKDLGSDFSGQSFNSFFDGIKVSGKAIKIFLKDRVVFVVVTTGALQGQTQPDGGGGLCTIKDAFDAKLLGIDPPFRARAVVAVKSRGDRGFGSGIGQEIARRLQKGEAVERHVGVVSLDHPIPPTPHRTLIVLLKTMAIGVTRRVQPRRGQALAVTRGSE